MSRIVEQFLLVGLEGFVPATQKVHEMTLPRQRGEAADSPTAALNRSRSVKVN